MTAQITSALRAITTASAAESSFTASVKAAFDTLPIGVKDYPYRNGELRFPLSSRGAKALISLAKPAKFGWREKTLEDRRVRSCWEIPKSKISLDKRLWNTALEPVLDGIRAKLNLPASCRLSAQLHNLLIYEPGDFFITHQDTEKHDGMVATLIVNLPSAHKGGALEVEHNGQIKRFISSRAPQDRFSFFAFYADCRHQVKPVTEGYRVTLTFNLVMQAGAAGRALPRAAENEVNLAELSAALGHWLSAPRRAPSDRPRRLAYLLDHEYTQKNLSWHGLKNNDRIRAECLRQVAAELGLVVHLALLDVQIIWSAYSTSDWGYGDYGYRSGRPSATDDEDSEYTLEEVIDETTRATYWLDADGKVRDFAGCDLYAEEVCWTTATDQFKPHEQQYEGYMGNYGNTLEYWYYRAAIVLWPREQHLAMLINLNADAGVEDLLRLLRAQAGPRERLALLRPCLPQIEASARHFSQLKPLYELALGAEDEEVALTLLAPLGWVSLTPATTAIFCELCAQYGPAWIERLLKRWSNGKVIQLRRADHKPGMDLTVLVEIVKQLMATVEGEELARMIVQWHVASELKQHRWCSKSLEAKARKEGAGKWTQAIFCLLEACQASRSEDLHAELLRHLEKFSDFYSPIHLIAALSSTQTRLGARAFFAWGFGQYATGLSRYIEGYLQQHRRAADDWCIRERPRCDCADCRHLNDFLASSTRRTLVWPLAEARRRHIHDRIDELDVPVTHVTRREGSPYKLQLTKTAELFQRHEQEVAALSEGLTVLRRLAGAE